MIAHRRQVAQLAARHRLPAVYPLRDFVEGGGLVAYGPSLRESFRLAAAQAHAILRGTRPADLAVQQPASRLVVNPAAAAALGLTLPAALLLRAEVVE